MKGFFDKVEKIHNKLSDTDFVWFPFLFLKLRPEELLNFSRLVVMTLCFALYFNLMLWARYLFVGEAFTIESFVVTFAYFVIGFFCWFSLVTRYFWNRRVSRLKGSQ